MAKAKHEIRSVERVITEKQTMVILELTPEEAHRLSDILGVLSNGCVPVYHALFDLGYRGTGKPQNWLHDEGVYTYQNY